jgi:hypothetical protein
MKKTVYSLLVGEEVNKVFYWNEPPQPLLNKGGDFLCGDLPTETQKNPFISIPSFPKFFVGNPNSLKPTPGFPTETFGNDGKGLDSR